MFDLDNSGVIDKKEIRMVLQNSSIDIKDSEIDAIFEEIDIEKNETISYSEFLAVAMPIEKLVNNEKLAALFSEFDEDDS